MSGITSPLVGGMQPAVVFGVCETWQGGCKGDSMFVLWGAALGVVISKQCTT